MRNRSPIALTLLLFGCGNNGSTTPDASADRPQTNDTPAADASVDAPVTDAPVADAPVADTPITDAAAAANYRSCGL